MDGNDLHALVERGIALSSGDNNWSGHDRGTTVGASEIGACARRVFYDKHGVAQDPDFVQDWGAAERGKAIEDWFVARLRRAIAGTPTPPQLLFAGSDQKTLVRGAQSATPDGLLVPQAGDPVYLEIKSVDPRVYETMQKEKDQHRLQCLQGMSLLRAQTPHQPQRAIIAYINASFVSQRRYFPVDYDQSVADALRKRAEDLMFGGYTVAQPPRPEGKMEGGKECEYCPFYRTCTAHDVGCLPSEVRPLVDLPADKVAALHELVKQQQVLRMREDEMHNFRKSTEQQIVDMLVGMDTKKVQASWGSVSAYPQAGPTQYDYKKMIEDGMDISEYKRQSTPTVRVNTSLK